MFESIFFPALWGQSLRNKTRHTQHTCPEGTSLINTKQDRQRVVTSHTKQEQIRVFLLGKNILSARVVGTRGGGTVKKKSSVPGLGFYLSIFNKNTH